jgi:hypothetical protein
MSLHSDPLDENDVLLNPSLVQRGHHYHLMGPSEVTCLPTDCNVSELALLKSNPSSASSLTLQSVGRHVTSLRPIR